MTDAPRTAAELDAIAEAMDRALATIDHESEQLVLERGRPGWTTWAMYGAIGTLAWLMTEELKSGAVTTGCLFYFAYGHTIAAIWMLLGNKLNPVSPGLNLPRFDTAPSRFGALRPRFLLHTAEVFVVGGLYLLGGWPRWPGAEGAVVLLYGTWFAAFALGLVATLSDTLLIPRKSELGAGRAGRIGNWLGALAMSGAGAYILLAYGVPHAWKVPDILPDVRIALIVLAILAILDKLTEGVPVEASIRNLRQIRSDLAFLRTTPGEAIRRADVVLFGHRVEDIIDPDVSACVRLIQDGNSQLLSVCSYVSAIKQIAGRPPSAESHTAIQALVAQCRQDADLLRAVERGVEQHVHTLRGLAQRVQKVGGDRTAVDSVIIEITHQHSSLKGAAIRALNEAQAAIQSTEVPGDGATESP